MIGALAHYTSLLAIEKESVNRRVFKNQPRVRLTLRAPSITTTSCYTTSVRGCFEAAWRPQPPPLLPPEKGCFKIAFTDTLPLPYWLLELPYL